MQALMPLRTTDGLDKRGLGIDKSDSQKTRLAVS